MRYYLRIKNWARFQHYSKRNPPWIKLHKELLSSQTWVSLPDASKALAVASMLLASACDNKIPYDPDYIKRVAYLQTDPDIPGLVKTDFIEIIDENGEVLADASKALASCKQLHANARPETETETETETELKPKHLRSSVDSRVLNPTEKPKPVKRPRESNPSLQAGFEKFYAAYPRKESKASAMKVWQSLKPGEPLADTILQAVQRALTSEAWTKDNGKWVPYPASWLRGRRWEDGEGQRPSRFEGLL